MRLGRVEKVFHDPSQSAYELFFARQIANGAADDLNLFVTGVDELESILEALAIADLSTEDLQVLRFRQLELQLDKFAQADVAGHSGAQAALTQIFGAAV